MGRPGVPHRWAARRARAGVVAVATLILFSTPSVDVRATAGAVSHAALVRTTSLSSWTLPSTDPSDVAYRPATGQLVIVDGEIEEAPAPYYHGANVFEATRDGTLQRGWDTTAWTDEPTGAVFNPDNGHLFISSDDHETIFELDPGFDSFFGTADDVRRGWSAAAFGSGDAEGIAFDAGTGPWGCDDRLFIADGNLGEVFVVLPGANCIFDGPTGDDVASHWDTANLGLIDLEAITYAPSRGTLYLLGTSATSDVVEVTPLGAALQVIDISSASPIRPAGLALAPGSDNPSETHLFIVDRGLDASASPSESDGRLSELRLVAGEAPNLVANGDMELDIDLDDVPDHWTKSAATRRRDSAARSGEFGLRIRSTDGVAVTPRQVVAPITPGAVYAFRAWVKIPATGGGLHARFDVVWLASTGASIGTTTIASYAGATAGWDRAFGRVLAPAGAVSAHIKIVVRELRTSLYIDDVVFGRAAA